MAVTMVSIACTPDAPPPGESVIPTIGSFTASSLNATSPAVVTLGWKIVGLNGQTADCRLESDNPTVHPIDISPCRPEESRNVTVTTGATATTSNFTLKVTTSLGILVNATTSFTVAPGATEPFNLTLLGLDSVDSAVAAAASGAAARWEQVVVSGFPDTTEFPSWCQDPTDYTLPDSVDDVAIEIQVAALDGPGGTLGSAGPKCILMPSERSVTGLIFIDEADVGSMIADGSLGNVILHEIGHVLGIGTLWDNSPWGVRELLSGSGTSDPRFTGPAASAEWQKLGGTGAVPLETLGGAGTAESHWRETTFTTELMTGWMDPGAQLSAVTVASLADIGFNVNLQAADAFSIGGTGAAARAGAPRGRLVEGNDFAPLPMTPTR